MTRLHPLKRPWLFGIGWAKTGSNSLAEALRILGLSAAHTGAFGSAHPDRDYRAEIMKRHQAGRDPFQNIFEPGDVPDAVIDWPVYLIWKQLLNEYDEAKFIITYRDPHKIALSYMRMAHEIHREAVENQWETSYQTIIDTVSAHYDNVFRYLPKYPDRFIVLDLEDEPQYKWRALCKFVDAPLSYAINEDGVRPWPHAFSHTNFLGERYVDKGRNSSSSPEN